MTDSEKTKKAQQIEEMQKIICNRCGQFDGCSISCKAHKDLAEAFYKAGYRQVDNIGDFTVYGFKNGYVKALVEKDEEIKKLKAEYKAFAKNMENVLEIEKKNAVETATAKIIGHLADLFGCPCNYSFADNDVGEYMGEYCENKYDDNCTCNDIECWSRVLNRWVNEE